MEFAEATAPFLESGSVRPPSYSSAVAGNGHQNHQERVPGSLTTPPPRYDDEIAPCFPSANQLGQPQGRRRTNSIASTASVLGDHRELRAPLQQTTLETTGCFGFTKSNRISCAYNELRKLNRNFGPKMHRVFFFGGKGSCSTVICNLIQAIIIFCTIAKPIAFKLLSEHFQVQAFPNLFTWLAAVGLDLIVLYIFVVAALIDGINRARFFRCPWVRRQHFMAFGREFLFRNVGAEEIATDLDLSKYRRWTPSFRALFPRGSQVTVLYCSDEFYKKNFRNTVVYYVFVLLLIIIAGAANIYIGLTSGQLVFP